MLGTDLHGYNQRVFAGNLMPSIDIYYQITRMTFKVFSAARSLSYIITRSHGSVRVL